jgi:hypothetical protein
MSDQDDWEFSGADDAKAAIRAAVCCELLRAAPPVDVEFCPDTALQTALDIGNRMR